jgi:methylmalonyl-CoA mutase
MKIDDFAPNLSFFFSNGMDAEYAVIGRVARRIWARAMKDIYKAGSRSQMLKYHIQTSGRSLHAREIQFNDIRTTLQAMYALFDNCNSLHTNAYDEALTAPERACDVRWPSSSSSIASWGSTRSESLGGLLRHRDADGPRRRGCIQGVRVTGRRGGVLGAMETMYQRGKIQEESLLYETRKHDGSLPIVGVNTFLNERDAGGEHAAAPLFRASDEEQRAQVNAVDNFQARHALESADALRRLQEAAASGGNVFGELLETVQVCSLGQITHALYHVGGQYRRHM